MNKKELAYYINSISENYVNESEEVAVRINSRLLFSFYELEIIDRRTYSNCYWLIQSNKASDVEEATSILYESLEVFSWIGFSCFFLFFYFSIIVNVAYFLV